MAQIIKMSEEVAAKVWNRLSYYEGSNYTSWHEGCQQNRSFYFGNQYTDEEREKLEERGQYDLVINKVRKAIRGLTGLMSANIPKYKIISLDDSDSKKSIIGNKLLDWVWKNSDGLATYAAVIKNALIDNIAYMHVIYSNNRLVKFVPLTFDDVVVDPTAKSMLFDDAEMIAIRKYVSVDFVKSVYGLDDVYEELPSAAFGGNFYNSGTADFLGKVFSEDKQYVRIYECYKKEFYRAEKGEVYNRIVKETILGYRHVYREELPPEITEFPIIPLYVEGGENPYKLGEVAFLKDMQRFINKSFAVTLLNAQLMSNPKIVTTEQAVPMQNREDFENNLAVPGSITYLSGGVGDKPFFEVIQGQPLNQAFYSLYIDAKNEFDLATLPQQILGYNNSSQYQSDSQLLDKKETVLDSFKDFMYILDAACVRLARVSLQYVQGYLGKEAAIKILGADNTIERIKVNEQRGLDVSNEESIQQWIAQQKKNNVPDDDITAALERARSDSEFMNSLYYVIDNTDFSEYQISIIPGSYTPTYEMAMLRLMMELAQTQAVDPSVILRYAPVEDKEELIDRYDTINTLRSQIFSLQRQVEVATSEAQRARSAMTQAEQDVLTEKHEVKLAKLSSEMKIKALMAKYSAKLQNEKDKIKFQQTLQQMLMDASFEIQQEQLKAQERNGASSALLDTLVRETQGV